MAKWISLLSVLLVAPLAAQAANTHVSPQDRGWLTAAHQINLAEMVSGKLAEKSGRTAAVRDAGRMLAIDHEMLDAQLIAVAQLLGVELPGKPDAQQREQMNRFQSVSGMKFDATWTKDETADHVEAIREAEREIKGGSDSQVKDLAKAALAVLKKHLSTLQRASAGTGSW